MSADKIAVKTNWENNAHLDKNMNQLVALNERMKQVIDRQGMVVQANNKIKGSKHMH